MITSLNLRAFDTIQHSQLLTKLENYGLSERAILLMTSYLTNRYQRVKIGNIFSEWEKVQTGVPQGSVLGPLLFNIFLNDIFYVIESCKLYNFADDNNLSKSDKLPDTVSLSLKNDLTHIMAWFDANCFSSNLDKHKCMSMGKFSVYVQFEINGQIISPTSHAKILGVTIDHELKFKEHVSTICQKAARQLNVLKRLHKFLNEDSRLAIYRCFILSNFSYCPLVWHFCSIELCHKMEKIQERALRFVYSDFTSSYDALLKKGNHQMLYLNRLRNIATEVYKICNGYSPRYLSDLIERKLLPYNVRAKDILNQPKCNSVSYGLNSFRYKGPKIWNQLPNHLKEAVSLDVFKSLIKKWSGPKCLCTMCSSLL